MKLTLQSWIIVGLGIALAAALSLVGVQTVRLSKSQVTVAELRQAIETTQKEAAKVLAAETAKVLAYERADRDRLIEQEKIDAKNAAVVAKNASSLRARTRAGGGPGLRDPHAEGCRGSGGGAEAQAAAVADSGAGDGADAGRVLSEPFERDLVELVTIAERINIAYASCRARLIEVTAELTGPPTTAQPATQ